MVGSAVCLPPWRSSPPPPLSSFRSQQEAHSVSDRPIELCCAAASATCRAPPVPSQWRSRNHLSLWSTLTARVFAAKLPLTSLGKCTLRTHPTHLFPFHPFICSLRSLLFSSTTSASSPPSSFPSSGPPAWDAVRFRPGQKGREPLWARPAAVHPGTERPSAKLMVLAGPPPVSVPSQGLCCGPVLLFTQPPPDPLNCR